MAEAAPRPARSQGLTASLALFVLHSCVFGLLGLAILAVGIVGTSRAGGIDQADPGDLAASLAFFAVSGAGSFCGLQAILCIRAGDLRRAFRYGVAASLLPPIDALALAATLLLRRSDDWKAQDRPASAAVPQGRANGPSGARTEAGRAGAGPGGYDQAAWGLRPR